MKHDQLHQAESGHTEPWPRNHLNEPVPYPGWQRDIMEFGEMVREKTGQTRNFVIVTVVGPNEGELIASGSEKYHSGEYRDLRDYARILRQAADDYDARADRKDKEAEEPGDPADQ